MDIVFTDRETDIMAVLWDLGSATVVEVRDRLEDPLAYTTVLTVLQTLEQKGFVRHEEEGKAYRYFPRVEREAARRSALGRLMKRLFGGSPELVMTQLVSDRHVTEDELRRIRTAINERLKGDRG